MIRLKNEAEINILAEAGRRLAQILEALREATSPGTVGEELDQLAYNLIKDGGDEPAFLNYKPAGAKTPFPATLCLSLNDCVVHGLPGGKKIKAGDLVSLDLGLKHRGLFVDSALSFGVPPIKPEISRLLAATEEALAAGIKAAQLGGKIGDIGAAIQAVGERCGYGLVKELGGHGVGYQIHEAPDVPNLGRPGTGPAIKEGLVIAIEPMLTAGSPDIKLAHDGYGVLTRDGSLAAHFEHTVAITKAGPRILTTP